MSVIYKCKECLKVNKNMSKICEFCFWPVEKTFSKKEKKENKMNKEMAIKFLKSQQYVTQKFWKDKRVYEKYKDVIDLIQKWIPEENQDSLF